VIRRAAADDVIDGVIPFQNAVSYWHVERLALARCLSPAR
jgi:hypothetical protein